VPEDAAVLRTQVASLRAANESLQALLEDKDAKITELEVKLARLERLISRKSGNSSMPPSGDDQPGKTPPKQKPGRGAGKRKPGKQPGAPGAYLRPGDTAGLGVLADHVLGLPTRDVHEVSGGSSRREPAVRERPTEPVRVYVLDSRLLATAPIMSRIPESVMRTVLCPWRPSQSHGDDVWECRIRARMYLSRAAADFLPIGTQVSSPPLGRIRSRRCARKTSFSGPVVRVVPWPSQVGYS
jgi:hypothetical protein